ncbi:alpha/beta fold hydrolase [Agromyces sp. LHK192]|uniref:alpha/beta fold hydrolase n=1 Tax=Agromyces sp. LHK192 TaxID=2498704 RepID=UPI000FD7E4B6|nr:alpha/beta hydrolase [Agromyces sp. LHK192]
MTDFTASDGTRLHFDEHGDPAGRAVVLIAGFKAAATTWMYQTKALAKAGYRVIALDRRGHGASDVGPDGSHDMDRHGRDIRDLLDHLALEDATLVGGSMGGNSIWAMLAESGSARVRDVVIVDQTPKMLNDAGWAHGFYGFDASNADSYFATSIPDPGRFPLRSKGIVRIARILRAMRPGGGERGFTAAELELLNDHAKRDWRDAIAAADVPALFVAGAESEFWPASHAEASAALNRLATSAVIERDGHAANIEQPKAFNRALLEWLGRAPAA